MTAADERDQGAAGPQLHGRAVDQGRVYQAARDQLITEHHHHYQVPAQAAAPPVPVPDSVRTALVERPPRVLRNRSALRAALLAALAEGGGIHVVYGMGGCGKTSLAHWLFQEAQRQGHIALWVTASDRMSLRAAMLAVAADRGAHPVELIAAHNGQRAAADLVWHYLDHSPQPWLLVIDNADDPTLLEEGGWLRSSPTGTVVVTTRRTGAALWHGATLHHLDVLPLNDAAQVLCDLAPHAGTLQEAQAVARRLGCLPLALNLAGSYLSQQLLESWTMSEYHEHLDNDATHLIDQGAGPTAAHRESRHLVSRTWQITLNALATRGIPEATTLLRLLSCLSPDPLPLTILSRSAINGAGLDAVTPPLRGDQVEPALRALLDHSLAALHQLPTERHGAPTRCVQVHGVLLDSVHAGIPAEDRPAYLHAATHLLHASLPQQHPPVTDADHLRLIAPHATALLRYLDQATTSEAVQLAVRIAQQIHEAGDYQAAVALTTLAGDTSERLNGADHPDTLAARHQQGDSLRRLGKLHEAETVLRRVHGQRERILGADHPDTLQTAAALSVPFYLLGRPDECLTWMSRAIDGQRRTLGDNHLDTLKSRALVLEFLADTGHIEQFLTDGPATVADCERALGPDHPVTVIAYSNYAYGLLHASTPAAAEAAAHRALDARIRLHGPDHPLVYSAKLVLSWALMLSGSHEQAVTLMREALDGRERLLGQDHPLTIKARVLLAERLAVAGQHGEAQELLADNLANAEGIYGPDDPDVRRARAIYRE